MVPRKSTSDELMGAKMEGLNKPLGARMEGVRMVPRKSTSDELLGAKLLGTKMGAVVGHPWPQENPPQTSFWEPKWRA